MQAGAFPHIESGIALSVLLLGVAVAVPSLDAGSVAKIVPERRFAAAERTLGRSSIKGSSLGCRSAFGPRRRRATQVAEAMGSAGRPLRSLVERMPRRRGCGRPAADAACAMRAAAAGAMRRLLRRAHSSKSARVTTGYRSRARRKRRSTAHARSPPSQRRLAVGTSGLLPADVP
jgi:hypothetical protein